MDTNYLFMNDLCSIYTKTTRMQFIEETELDQSRVMCENIHKIKRR